MWASSTLQTLSFRSYSDLQQVLVVRELATQYLVGRQGTAHSKLLYSITRKQIIYF